MSENARLIGGLLGFTFALGAILIYQRVRARRPRYADRIAPYVGPRSTTSKLLTDAGSVTPFPVLEQFIAPWLNQLGHVVSRFGASPDRLRARLLRAGGDQSVEQFRAQQVLFAVLGLAAGLALAVSLRILRGSSPVALVGLVLICAVIGVLLCDYRLSSIIKARERRMMLEFPTIAELFALAVGAGETPTAALERVCRIGSGELIVELRALLNDIHAGTPFVRALEQLAGSTALPSLARFAQGIAVAVERGTPLADVLRDQAQDVRDSGRRALMELGGQKEVLMMLPVVFLQLPITVVFAVFPSAVTLHIGF